MTMPIDLVLVRHGMSEGNTANKASRSGDNSHFTDEFKGRHSSMWRLTETGVEQAEAAGKWLNENDNCFFDRHYVSTYIRAIETAAHLKLPGAEWYQEINLRERDWGDLDVMPDDERNEMYEQVMLRRTMQPYYWRPTGGESMADVDTRLQRVFDTLHRECSDKRVIITCHGEVMWGFRFRLERMTMDEYLRLDASKNPHNHIHNCQIVHYTRRDPLNSRSSLSEHLDWMRMICPWDTTKSSNEWFAVERSRASNESLLAQAESVPRLVNG